MGLWGAAQAIAAGFGGLLGAGATDILRGIFPASTAFGTVFVAEALLFVFAAALAARVMERPAHRAAPHLVPGE